MVLVIISLSHSLVPARLSLRRPALPRALERLPTLPRADPSAAAAPTAPGAASGAAADPAEAQWIGVVAAESGDGGWRQMGEA